MNCLSCTNCDKFRKQKDQKNYILDTNLEDYECNICLGEYYKGQSISMLVCNHIFHRKCIEYWFEKKKVCPICNINIQT